MDVSNNDSGTQTAETNAWIGSAGPGGFDLRSDTMTTPTASMLRAIQGCTLLNDIYQEDTTVESLEAHLAALTGKEAALLVLTGTMANQISLRTLLTQPPHGVLCDSRSHIFIYEAGGVSANSGAMVQPIAPANGVHLTLGDVKRHAVVHDDVHDCPTKVISFEVPLNGMVMPLAEARRISEWARQRGIKLHCDGARLWEAAAGGHGSLSDYASCFDTVSLCLSKGIGAPMGSVIVGTKETITRARWLRKMMGGGWKHAGMIAAAARAGLDEVFGQDESGKDAEKLRRSHELAQEIRDIWQGLGGKLVHPVHTNMIFIDLDAIGVEDARAIKLAKEAGLAMEDGRIVVSYQTWENRDAVLPRLKGLLGKIMDEAVDVNGVANGDEESGWSRKRYDMAKDDS